MSGIFVDLTSEDEKDFPAEIQSQFASEPVNAFSVLMGASRKVFSPNQKILPKHSETIIDNNSQHHQQQQPSSSSSSRRWNQRDGGSRKAPGYKMIRFGKMSTPIVVDGFQYASEELSDIYVLTHFHSDHYGGLTSKFSHGKIYCTQTTANLIALRLHVPIDRIVPLELNKRHTITMSDGVHVYVTLFDANHCPGAACFIFNTDHTSETILHTGDFRFHPKMLTECPDLKALSTRTDNSRMLTIYLDTTYCDPTYSFPPQEETLDAVVATVRKELGLGLESDRKLVDVSTSSPLGIVDLSNEEVEEEDEDGEVFDADNNKAAEEGDKDELTMDLMNCQEELVSKSTTMDKNINNPLHSEKVLFLFGAYGIGKERVYMRVAESLSRKVHVDANRRSVMDCYSDWPSNMYGKFS